MANRTAVAVQAIRPQGPVTMSLIFIRKAIKGQAEMKATLKWPKEEKHCKDTAQEQFFWKHGFNTVLQWCSVSGAGAGAVLKTTLNSTSYASMVALANRYPEVPRFECLTCMMVALQHYLS